MSETTDQTIRRLVYLFRLVSDMGIVPQSMLTRRSSFTHGAMLQKNRNIVMLILMLNFVHKMVRKCYKFQEMKLMNGGEFEHAPL